MAASLSGSVCGCFFSRVEPGLKARAGRGAVFQRGLHEGHGVFGMFGVLAVAIHVDGQRAVAQTGQVTGAALGVIVEPPPFMHHHNARARAFNGVVVGVIADHLVPSAL